MDRPIQVGDLVIAVRGHSCVLEKIGGLPYRVGSIIQQKGGGWHCPVCRIRDIAPYELLAAHMIGLHKDNHSGIPLGWLKRIPPLSELEGQKTEENLKEKV